MLFYISQNDNYIVQFIISSELFVRRGKAQGGKGQPNAMLQKRGEEL